jgi:hypothetical protein
MIRTSAWALVQAGVAPDAICSLADLVTRITPAEAFHVIVMAEGETTSSRRLERRVDGGDRVAGYSVHAVLERLHQQGARQVRA